MSMFFLEMSDMWLWQYSLEIRNKIWKKLGATWKWTSWFLANEEIHNIMIGDNDPSHKIIWNKRKILKNKNLSKRKIYSQKCHKCLVHIFTHDWHAHSSQFNILVSFLHVFREFRFTFTCDYILALRKFTRYIYHYIYIYLGQINIEWLRSDSR